MHWLAAMWLAGYMLVLISRWTDVPNKAKKQTKKIKPKIPMWRIIFCIYALFILVLALILNSARGYQPKKIFVSFALILHFPMTQTGFTFKNQTVCCFIQILTIKGSQCLNVVSQLSSYSQSLFHLQIGFSGGDQGKSKTVSDISCQPSIHTNTTVQHTYPSSSAVST